MSQRFVRILTMLAMLNIADPSVANLGNQLESRCAQAHAVFDGAEQRFQLPSAESFNKTQTLFREEVERVGRALDAHGSEYAAAWKTHLRWHLLENNLFSKRVNLDELKVVRRWMYSNRKGLEYPFFAQLRQRMDVYLDSVFAFSQENLREAFEEKVVLARQQCLLLSEDATLANAAALGQTLGWFERTGQLTRETSKVRSLLSQPNCQIIISSKLAHRLLSQFEVDVHQTVNISSTETSPPSRIYQRPRTMHVRGTATAVGTTSLKVVPNNLAAEIRLVYVGQINSNCRADAGPILLDVQTVGPVMAVKPFYLDLEGLKLGETQVYPQETTRLKKVTSRSEFFRRVGMRRANQHEAKAFMRSRARNQTVTLIQRNLDKIVVSTLTEIKSEFQQLKNSMSGFQDVLAPVVREGAQPRIHSLHSSNKSIVLNVENRRRDQFGAVTSSAFQSRDNDLQAHIHVSYFNNMAETILGGKRLSDTFLMKYAKILQAELPLPLMVHSRATHWAITTTKRRPLELRIPEPNRFELVLQINSVQMNHEKFITPTTATIYYHLVKNEYGEYQLIREGEIELTSTLPTEHRLFLHEKLDAFFAPVLDGGGVVIPDGGILGAMNDIKSTQVLTNNNWITIGVNIPLEAMNEIINALELPTASAADPSS